MRTAESSVEDARTANLGLSVCYGLGTGACVIALLVGDLATAEHYVDMLLDHATRLSLTYWRDYGHCLRGALSIARGHLDAGLQLLRAGFDGRGGSRLARQMNTLLVSEALGRAGQTADGLVAIEEAIGHAEHTDERWLLAELLRIKGELLLLESAPGAATVAEDLFWQALDWARRQGARSWELRTVTSLARLFLDQKRSADARAVLQPVYDQFAEAFDTADLKAAKALLSTLN